MKVGTLTALVNKKLDPIRFNDWHSGHGRMRQLHGCITANGAATDPNHSFQRNLGQTHAPILPSVCRALQNTGVEKGYGSWFGQRDRTETLIYLRKCSHSSGSVAPRDRVDCP